MSPEAVFRRASPAGRAALWLLGGHLLLGLGHVAAMPPWEGFDETAHFSYIQEIADRRELPRLYESRVSTDVEGYTRLGPLPYSLEAYGGTTYEAFFARPGLDLAEARALVHDPPEAPRRYAAGDRHNWQSQHPPLYYSVLAPLYASTRYLSWGMQLFTLRAASYLLAWLALLLGTSACLAAAPWKGECARSSREWAALGIALWPLLFPSWFPDMARIGNDSACALLLAAVCWLTLRADPRRYSPSYAIALGALLGAGCLTKVFFVPVTVACLGFWAVRAWTLRGPRGLASDLPRMVMTLLVIGVLAGWWYVEAWLEQGVPAGGLELVELQRKGGLLVGLAEKVSLSEVLKAPLDLGVTLAWPGTWSLVGVSLLSLAPIGLTMSLVAGAYLTVLLRCRLSDIVWLPAWLGGVMLLALGWQTLVRMALLGKGQPAYYLNFLAPALGAAVGMGLARWWRHGAFRRAIAGGVAYAFLFGVGIFWAQAMLFSGLRVWYGTDGYRAYSAAALLDRALQLPGALERLAVLSYPYHAGVVWLIGSVLLSVGLVKAWNAARDLERDHSPAPVEPSLRTREAETDS